MSGAYEPVIGIETHVELTTASKMFCGCAVAFGAEPNTNVCPVCLGLPGALPVLNERAVEYAMAIGLALDCAIAPRSVFHRKNYFYPDLPKNYQISQYDLPLCSGGHLDVEVDGELCRVGITRVHMEEDTGKSLHVGTGGRIQAADHTLLDFNRSGVPLMEVVSEPDLRTADEARLYAQELQALLLALGVSDAKLEEGSLRFDANVSLRTAGSTELGTKVEVKNMNSFRSLQRALAFEIDRQREVLEAGGTVVQETRHWNEEAERTEGMRSKEEAFDYRYFLEPDLVPVEVSEEWRARVAGSLPELPGPRRRRYAAMGLDPVTAGALAAETHLGGLFEAAVGEGGEPATVANWLTGEVVAYARREALAPAALPLQGGHLARLAAMVQDGALSATAAKEVLGAVLAGEGDPEAVAEARDLIQVSDADALAPIVDRVLGEHPDAAAKLQAGDDKVVGFLVGHVMRASGGKADPRTVSELIRARAGR